MYEIKTWYAVTNEKEESYEWDNGSHNYEEAVQMLKEQGEGEIVTVSELFMDGKMTSNFAIERVEYNEIF
mgnify:FL=1